MVWQVLGLHWEGFGWRSVVLQEVKNLYLEKNTGVELCHSHRPRTNHCVRPRSSSGHFSWSNSRCTGQDLLGCYNAELRQHRVESLKNWAIRWIVVMLSYHSRSYLPWYKYKIDYVHNIWGKTIVIWCSWIDRSRTMHVKCKSVEALQESLA